MSAVPACRVVDYFLVVGTGQSLTPIDVSDAKKPLPETGTLEASSPSSPKSYIDRVYRGEVVARFPLQDHKSVPLPEGIAMFCIPDSISLTTSSSEMPILYYFAATQSNGSRLYGACLKFYEQVPAASIAELEEADRQAQQSLHSLSSSPEAPTRPVRATSTTESPPEHESNPLSTTEGDAEEMMMLGGEHSLSGGSLTEERSVTRVKTAEASAMDHNNASRSPSLTPRALHRSLQAEAAVAASAGVQLFTPSASPTPNDTSSTMPATIASTTAGSSSTAPTIASFTASSSNHEALAKPQHIRGQSHSITVISPQQRKIYAPKCLCILSLHPFLEQYRMFLTELYRISLTPTPIPLERYISNFMLEVPLPPLGELKYQYSISNTLLTFQKNAPNNPLKYIHSSEKNRASRILTLFELLDLENIIFILECILLEKRILFLSNRLSLLTLTAEIFLHLMYPFTWPHVYIPLLPRSLSDFLYAPMPFIIGMHHSWIKGSLHGEMLTDLVVVDLDKNTVQFTNNPHTVPPTHRASTGSAQEAAAAAYGQSHTHHSLPAKERKKLKLKLKPFQALFSRVGFRGMNSFQPQASSSNLSASSIDARPPHQAYQLRLLDELDLAFPSAPLPDEMDSIEQYEALVQELQQQEDEISLAFFRCFVSMFKDYREFLIYPTPLDPNPDPCFRLKDFLKKQGILNSDVTTINFYTSFANTQAFQRFCEERIYHAPPPGGVAPSANGPASSPQNTSTTLTPQLLSHYAIQHFDESINAKRNRSRFTLGKRHPTPFLDDNRYEIRATVMIPPPEDCNLPLDANGKKHMYTYNTFPDKFDENLFWGQRLVHPSKRLRELQTSSNSAAAPTVVAGMGGCEGGETILGKNEPRRRSIGGLPAAGFANSLFASQAHAASSVLTNQLALEVVWFSIVCAECANFHSVSLLKMGLDRLDVRLREVEQYRSEYASVWQSLPPSQRIDPPVEEVFLKLMRACGACAQADLAIDIFQRMVKLEEYKKLEDSPNAYNFLLQIFSMNQHELKGFEALAKLKRSNPPGGHIHSSSIGMPLQLQLHQALSPDPTSSLVASSISRSYSASSWNDSFARSASPPAPHPNIDLNASASGASNLNVTAGSPSFMRSASPANYSNAASPVRMEGGNHTPAASSPASPPVVSSPALMKHSPKTEDDEEEEDRPDECSIPEGVGSSAKKPYSKHRGAPPSKSRRKKDDDDDDEPLTSVAGVMSSGVSIVNRHGDDDDDDDDDDGEFVDDSTRTKLRGKKPLDHNLKISLYLKQFKAVFPNLTVDLLDSCPECEKPLTDIDIRAGWTGNENDYTTKCPSCNERFVARFTVRPSNPAGAHDNKVKFSQMALESISDEDAAEGEGVEKKHRPQSASYGSAPAILESEKILCEYLPPLVLRKEVCRALDEHGISHITSHTFRQTSPTLFWNLIWHLTNERYNVECITQPQSFVTPPKPALWRKKLAAERAKKEKNSKTKKENEQSASSSSVAASSSSSSVAASNNTLAVPAGAANPDLAYRASMSAKLDAALARRQLQHLSPRLSTHALLLANGELPNPHFNPHDVDEPTLSDLEDDHEHQDAPKPIASEPVAAEPAPAASSASASSSSVPVASGAASAPAPAKVFDENDLPDEFVDSSSSEDEDGASKQTRLQKAVEHTITDEMASSLFPDDL